MLFAVDYVTEEMLEECLLVIRAAFADVADDFGLTAQNCPTHPAFMTAVRLRSDFDAGKRMFAITVDDGTVIGFAQITLEMHGAKLERLGVVPTFRHNGCGTVLVQHGETIARAVGAPRLTIEIIDENNTLKCWYASLGFVHTGTARFPHLPFTVGFMEKPLL